jgi:hypothetical protein
MAVNTLKAVIVKQVQSSHNRPRFWRSVLAPSSLGGETTQRTLYVGIGCESGIWITVKESCDRGGPDGN